MLTIFWRFFSRQMIFGHLTDVIYAAPRAVSDVNYYHVADQKSAKVARKVFNWIFVKRYTSTWYNIVFFEPIAC